MTQVNNQIVLVTGGSGFVGVHCIVQLLEAGYKVKTTLRSFKRIDEIISMVKSAGVDPIDRLTFVEADLLKDEGWKEAVAGCAYVLHVASPFPATQPEDENDLIIPARDGALRVLKAARDGGVKRVVLTSSFAAIGYSVSHKGYVFTEKDWTEPSNENLLPYIKSKTIAEQEAWKFIEKEGGGLELAVINPTGIFGPVLGHDFSASIQIVQGILTGQLKESPAYSFGVVDVRDVASLHILAMTTPKANGERFIATTPGAMTFADIAQLIKNQRSGWAEKVADLKAIDPVDYVQISNEKATSVLGWQPRTRDEAILATVDSLIKLGSNEKH